MISFLAQYICLHLGMAWGQMLLILIEPLRGKYDIESPHILKKKKMKSFSLKQMCY